MNSHPKIKKKKRRIKNDWLDSHFVSASGYYHHSKSRKTCIVFFSPVNILYSSSKRLIEKRIGECGNLANSCGLCLGVS